MLASDIKSKRSKPRLTVVATKFSQSTPTTHIYQKDPNDPPYSPTESTSSFISSISGLAEKSASELGSLLKGAYRSLKEKEKNLVLAAEIGKSLLEHNQTLKSDYDKLLQTLKTCELETPKKIPADSTYEQDDSMRLVSAKKAYESIIESLELKNAEIQVSLEETQQQAQLDTQAYSQRQRKLETEIEILRGNLDIAAQKVQELEEYSQMQQDRYKQLDDKRNYEQRRNQDLALMEELTVKMEELFIENKHLYMSKKSVEEKLLRSLQDLESLRKEFESLELTQQSYETLLEAFETQKVHIRELNDSLEDHRLILSRWRDKGVWSPQSSAAPSESGHQSVFSTCVSKESLLGELEKAWTKNGLTKSQSDSNLSSKKSFYNAPADYAILSTTRSLFDEAEHLLQLSNHKIDQYDLFEPEGNGSVYAERNLYPKFTAPLIQHQDMIMLEKPKKGLINLIQFQIRYLFRSLLRWCRFSIILSAAIFINLWKGPELLKQM